MRRCSDCGEEMEEDVLLVCPECYQIGKENERYWMEDKALGEKWDEYHRLKSLLPPLPPSEYEAAVKRITESLKL